jgi:hypothetical protein
MKALLIGSVIVVLLMSGVSFAVDDGKWQEAQASIDKASRSCSEQDKQKQATERFMGCTQSACKQAQKLAAQTLGHDVPSACSRSIRVGECHKGPDCK